MTGVSNVALSLKMVVDDIFNTSGFLNKVYDPQLTFQTGVQNLRRRNNRASGALVLDPTAPLTDADIPPDTVPLLIYNRSVLRRAEEFGRRAEIPTARLPKPTDAQAADSTEEFSVVIGEYDINLLAVFSHISELEKFEVSFYTRAAANRNHVIKVENPLVPGDMLSYSVWWEDLDDMQNILETNQYMSAGARAKVVGPFYLYKTQRPLITEVQSQIYT